MTLIKCDNCNKKVSDKAVSCVHCGANLKKNKEITCPECGVKLKENIDKCFECGFPIIPKNEKSSTLREDKTKALTCPNCNSDKVSVQLISKQKQTGCLTYFIYLFLALTVVGIPIIIIILLLKSKKTINQKYYVCQNCGKTFNSSLGLNQINLHENKTLITIIFIIMTILLISIAVSFNTKESDYVDFNQYVEININKLHNDYMENEIAADDMHKGKYYTFSGQIDDITKFFTDHYLVLKYKTDVNYQTISVNAYFNSSDDLLNFKKGDEVVLYCKYKQKLFSSSYSFHSCRVKN